MKTLSFNFESPSEKDQAVKEVIKRFRVAGSQVITSEFDAKTSTRAGVKFRALNLTFADGQTVAMAFKATGDVFEVKVNGKVLPLKNQDDYVASISEIVSRLDAGRSGFQKALARSKVPLPPSIRVSRTKMRELKIEKRDALKEVIQGLKDEYQRLTGKEAPALA